MAHINGTHYYILYPCIGRALPPNLSFSRNRVAESTESTQSLRTTASTICMIERSDWTDQFKVLHEDNTCSGVVVVDKNENCDQNCFRPSYPLTDLR